MCSGGSHTPSRVRGFPIRTSTDRSLVGSSPWLFAATHVLHRHQAPRHPPLALCSLENQRCSCSLWNSQGSKPYRQRTPPARGQRGHEGRPSLRDRSLKTEQKKSDSLHPHPGGQVLRQCASSRSRVVRASTGNLPERMSDKDSL